VILPRSLPRRRTPCATAEQPKTRPLARPKPPTRQKRSWGQCGACGHPPPLPPVVGDCPTTAAPLRPPLAGSGPLCAPRAHCWGRAASPARATAPVIVLPPPPHSARRWRAPAPFVRRGRTAGGGRRAPRTATEQDRCRRRLASGQSPPGVGVKGMRPPAYAGFKKRRPPSASLRSLSGGGAIAPTPPERPPFSGGRPPGSPLPGWGSRGCGLAFAPAAQPPTAQARYADARPRLRSPLNVVSVRTTALPARSRTRRPAPVRLGSFRFRPSARSPSLASGCLALGNARKLADLGRRCLQKRSGSEIRAD